MFLASDPLVDEQCHGLRLLPFPRALGPMAEQIVEPPPMPQCAT